jgi:signal transduction histidine kinase
MLHYTLAQPRTGAVDPCTWLFVSSGGVLFGASAAPPGLPLTADIHAAATSGTAVSTTLHLNGTRYFVLTQRFDGEVRQAVFDARYQMSDRAELFTALVIAELIGLLIACVTGVLLARLAIAPLDEALRRQRRFVADASHELRTPLTRLHTRAQLLLRREVPDDVGTELRRVVDSSRELNEIVDDLLRSAVLSAGRPDGAPVDLALIAASVVDAEQPRALLDDVVLVSRIGDVTSLGRDAVVVATNGSAPPADVVAAGSSAIVAGVESALRRMVSALVDNALRHSHPGGRVTVTVAAADRGRVVELVVADNGIGLDPADNRRVFERFHRGTPGKSGSHGLGLALVREIVEAHGGAVTAAGRPGVGTDFVVRLPAYAAPKLARRPS